MPGFEIFGEEERLEVGDVLETGVLFRYGFDAARKGIWKTRSFEQEVARRAGVRYCLACSSGTAALTIALASCGVGAGDEVIVPPFTFIATVEAVLSAGAIPVFAEIDETLCLSAATIEAAITSNTKAVIVVHMCGAMAEIDKIARLCNQRDIILIEDACQSFGASFGGKPAGSFGQVGCYSFDSVKTITCGEGGAMVTNDEEIYKIADAFADHGHDHAGSDRGAESHAILGYNYRICELNAAVGLAQIRKLDHILERQRANKKSLKDVLRQFPQLGFRRIPDEDGDSATFLTFFLPNENFARQAASELKSNNVDGCFYWYDNNWHYLRKWDHLKSMSTASRYPQMQLRIAGGFGKEKLPQSNSIISRAISIQIKLSWSEEDIEKRIGNMITTMKKVFNGNF